MGYWLCRAIFKPMQNYRTESVITCVRCNYYFFVSGRNELKINLKFKIFEFFGKLVHNSLSNPILLLFNKLFKGALRFCILGIYIYAIIVSKTQEYLQFCHIIWNRYAVLSWSGVRPFAFIICPRYLIWDMKNSHFSELNLKP